jgi:AcrR family transcriptional regulator
MTVPFRARSDALRNSGKVLEAARQVFAEKGTGAGIDEVALRAGVGKATVYRCYPTKEELLAAVAGARVTWFTELVLEAVAISNDPWQSFRDLLRTAARSQADNALLSAGLGAIRETEKLHAQRVAYRAALQQLLERGKDQGRVRADATAWDVTVLFNGAARVLHDQGERDVAVWRRYADLVTDAFRA